MCKYNIRKAYFFLKNVEFQFITALFTVLDAGLLGHNFHLWNMSTSFHSCITENVITDKKLYFEIGINLILATNGSSSVRLVAVHASAVDKATWKFFIILILVLRQFTSKCPLVETL
jgi:hypothetical protein